MLQATIKSYYYPSVQKATVPRLESHLNMYVYAHNVTCHISQFFLSSVLLAICVLLVEPKGLPDELLAHWK